MLGAIVMRCGVLLERAHKAKKRAGAVSQRRQHVTIAWPSSPGVGSLDEVGAEPSGLRDRGRLGAEKLLAGQGDHDEEVLGLVVLLALLDQLVLEQSIDRLLVGLLGGDRYAIYEWSRICGQNHLVGKQDHVLPLGSKPRS